MVTSLYRQYRPQNFAELVGQNHIRVTLQNEIKDGKISHAYLFAGPRGIGKTTTARLLAKAINCETRKAGEWEPCDKCAACTEITQGKNLDVLEIDAASHTGVDNVRENIIESARFTPSRLKYKVFIIDEVHMLTTPAFNALLKTLEEPPSHAVFILCTTELHKIPATIISRCQRFDFRRVALTDVVSHLGYICKKEGVVCDQEVLQSIARRSEGYLRDAVGVLGQILSIGEKKIGLEQAELVLPRSNFLLVFELTEELSQKDLAGALKLISRLVDEGINLQQFTLEVVEFWRQLMLAKIFSRPEELSSELTAEQKEKLKNILDKLTLGQLVLMIDLFLAKGYEIKQSNLPQLPLELAIIQICLGAENSSGGSSQNPGGGSASSGGIKSPVKKAVTSEPENIVKKNEISGLEVSALEAKWGELINGLNDSNHALALTLKVGRPIAVLGNSVQVGFKYKFHQEMVALKKNLLTLEEALSRVMGVPLQVEPVVADNLELNFMPAKASDEVDSSAVAEMFEGKVIN